MFDKWPNWLGGIPALTTMLIIIGYIIVQHQKNKPLLEKIASDERLNIKTGYRETIARLEKNVHDCHQESRQREDALQKEIDTLKQRINNAEWQRTQSDISLVSVLLDILPAPQMKQILEALKKKQATLPVPPEIIEGAEQ